MQESFLLLDVIIYQVLGYGFKDCKEDLNEKKISSRGSVISIQETSL